MLRNPTLPRPSSPLFGQGGFPTREWYDYWQALVVNADASALKAEIDALRQDLANLPGVNWPTVYGPASVVVAGALENGLIELRLDGDAPTPEQTEYYGTDGAGLRGWHPLLVAALGDVDLTLLADGDLLAWNETAEKWEPRTLATTDDLPEGGVNLYFTDARVYEAAKAQLVPGSGITITHDDLGQTITISASGGGGGGSSRTTAATSEGMTDVIMSKTQLLIDISCDVAARIRIYGTSANRTADASRSRGTEAPQGAGLLLEFITTGSFLGALLTPGIIAFNSDSIVLGKLYFNVEPDTSPTAAVVVGYLPLES